MVENPLQLGPGKISVHKQTGAGLDHGPQSAFAQVKAGGLRPAVLPHDGVVNWHSGAPVPDHGGLTLIGDAHGANIVSAQPGRMECLVYGGELTLPDRHRIMFDPTGLWVDLRQFLLGQRNNAPIRIKNNAA